MRLAITFAFAIPVLLSVVSCDLTGDKAMEYIDEKAEEAVPPTTQSTNVPVPQGRNPTPATSPDPTGPQTEPPGGTGSATTSHRSEPVTTASLTRNGAPDQQETPQSPKADSIPSLYDELLGG